MEHGPAGLRDRQVELVNILFEHGALLSIPNGIQGANAFCPYLIRPPHVLPSVFVRARIVDLTSLSLSSILPYPKLLTN